MTFDKRAAAAMAQAKRRFSELSEPERESLRALRPPMHQESIPVEHLEKFLRMKLVIWQLGRLSPTLVGKLAANLERHGSVSRGNRVRN